MIRFALSLCLATMLAAGCSTSNQDAAQLERHEMTPIHYDIALELSPESQSIRCDVTVRVPVTEPGSDSLTFGLHRQLTLDTLIAQSVASVEFDTAQRYPLPYVPQGRVLTVRFERPLEVGKEASIRIKYHGRITDWTSIPANQITAKWVEIGNFTPWFPFNHEYGDFTYSLLVDVPRDYQVRSLGGPTIRAGKWEFEWSHPTNDILVIAAPKEVLDQRTLAVGKQAVAVYYAGVSDSLAGYLSEQLLQAQKLCAGWFGDTTATQMTLVLSPRSNGAGYARRGVVVLAGVDENAFYRTREQAVLHLFRELAHIWWWRAPVDTWEDWLNESFAEFSALLAVRARLGEATYSRIMAMKQHDADLAPPIWGAPREATDDVDERRLYSIYYAKGPVLLAELENRISHEGFLGLCRTMQTEKVASTTQMLKILRRQSGDGVADWFERRLTGR